MLLLSMLQLIKYTCGVGIKKKPLTLINELSTGVIKTKIKPFSYPFFRKTRQIYSLFYKTN